MNQKEYRTELYGRTAERFGVGTKSVGIDAVYEFATHMLPALQRAVKHPDMTEELADILSTQAGEVEYHVERGVSVRDE